LDRSTRRSSAPRLARRVHMNVTSSTLSIIYPYSSTSISVAVYALPRAPLLAPTPRPHHFPSGRGRSGDGGGSSSKSHIEEDSCDGGSSRSCEAYDPAHRRRRRSRTRPGTGLRARLRAAWRGSPRGLEM
jgi:hypothetical protein